MSDKFGRVVASPNDCWCCRCGDRVGDPSFFFVAREGACCRSVFSSAIEAIMSFGLML